MDTKPFWIGFGDIHEQIGNIHLIPNLAEASGVLVSGDLTNRGKQPVAERILDQIQKINPRIYAQIGNMDYPEVEHVLEAQGMNIHAKGLDLGNGVGLMGVGYSNPTPFGTPGEVPDDQLAIWLDQAHEPVKNLPHLLLVAHNPPFDTATDRVGGTTPVGSRAVRNFIEQVQPEICLTGHIHESRAESRIGRTLIINPGPIADGGYVLIQLTDSGLQAQMRTTGKPHSSNPQT